MDFTVVDDIKEAAATVSSLAEQAKSLADKGLNAAKNFVCVQILTVYQMAYATAGQVIAVPYMAIKMAKLAIKKLESEVIQGAQDTFGSAVSSLMTTYSTEIVTYDPETGQCTTEKKPSKIESDPSYAQQALHALKAAKNCPLLDSVTSTSGFQTTFSAAKLLAALDGASADAMAAAFANALTNLATGMVANLADALKDTAFGKLKEAKSMYQSALKQSGVEELFKLLGQGQSCLMDLCDDEAVLLKLEDMPLTPYLEKAGGFVEEQLEKVDSSYFTFTFDFEKSSGADKVAEKEEEQIDTTLYEPLPVVSGMQFSNLGFEGIKNLNTIGTPFPEPYWSYYKAYCSYCRTTFEYTGIGGGAYPRFSSRAALVALNVLLDATSLETVHLNKDCGEFFYGDYYDTLEKEFEKIPNSPLLFFDYVVRALAWTLIGENYFVGYAAPANDGMVTIGTIDILEDSASVVVTAFDDADLILCNTEPGTLGDINSATDLWPLHVADDCTYKDSTGGKHHAFTLRYREKRLDCKSNIKFIPDYFTTYTTATVSKTKYVPFFEDPIGFNKKYKQLEAPSSAHRWAGTLPQETANTYTLFPFKKK